MKAEPELLGLETSILSDEGKKDERKVLEQHETLAERTAGRDVRTKISRLVDALLQERGWKTRLTRCPRRTTGKHSNA